MPKVHHVKARKDYPNEGIQKGDMYYTWNLLLGPRSSRTYRSKKPPKRSQLTASEFLQTLYDIEDDLATASCPEDATDIKERMETLRDDTQEKLDNMPEGLQQGSSGELLQQRVDGLEAAISEIEDWLNEHEDEWDTRNDEYKEDAVATLVAISIDC